MALVAADTDLDGPLTVADLAAMGLLSTREGGLMRRLLEDRLGRDAVRRSVVLESAHNVTLAAAAAAGAGAAFVSEGTANRASAMGLRVVHPVDQLEREIYILHRHESLSPAAAAFVGFAPGALA